MAYVVIEKAAMDEKLKATKGWVETVSGNEYLYDFHMKNIPAVIKVASSIRLDTGRGRNKGADALRVFAVEKDTMGKEYKVIRGLVKTTRVYRTTNWRTNLQKAVLSTLNRANIVYDKYRRQK